MPLNKKYPIAELMAACRAYPGLSNARRITFEYVMLKGINDSPAEARALVKLLAGIPAKINLIPFNPWPGSGYECSDWETIERFADIVNRGRLRLAGAHAARPRHPGRLRPAQERERAPAHPRAHGAGSDDRGVGRGPVADLLRLLFLVPIGFIAAVLAAALTILAGWYGHERRRPHRCRATGYVIGVGGLAWCLRSASLAGVPAFIVIVLAEMFRWRSVFFYLAVGGGLRLRREPASPASCWQTRRATRSCCRRRASSAASPTG